MNGLPEVRGLPQPDQGRVEPDHDPVRRQPAQVAELKRQPGRELQIHGSAQLAQSLLAAGLIDSLRLVIAPVVVGRGRRLFPDGGAPAGLRLVSHQTTPGGLSVHIFETTGLPEFGTYGADAWHPPGGCGAHNREPGRVPPRRC